MRKSTADDFWKRVVVTATNECWLWAGPPNLSGYGQLGRRCGNKVRKYLAHRYSYEISFGPIPEGLHVLHTCDVRLCVNPSHLFIGTNADNMRDKVSKDRHTYGEATHQAILTEEQVLDIKRSNIRPCDIARKYGVAASTVTNIRAGRTWKHLP